ncbi:MAG: hypothetical protein ACKPCM_14880 [Pseudanabaena sp.]
MISSHDLQTYTAGYCRHIAGAKQRQKQILLDDRYEFLQTVAHKGAKILKTDFDASKVWLYQMKKWRSHFFI